MLRRFTVHLALVLLFAFTQIGVATHEIRHVTEGAKHSQDDKQNLAEQCDQCLSYAKVANGLTLGSFVIPAACLDVAPTTKTSANFHSPVVTAYFARAPPQKVSA